YLWAEAKLAPPKSTVTLRPTDTPRLAKQFAEFESQIRHQWQMKLQKMGAQGRIAFWGAGAKGVTLANLVDPDCCWINSVVDLNPKKQGCYIPGTGHPIISPDHLAAQGITAILIMNPNYRDEIASWLHQANLKIAIIDPDEL